MGWGFTTTMWLAKLEGGGIENPIHVISFLSVRRLKCVEKYILRDNKGFCGLRLAANEKFSY